MAANMASNMASKIASMLDGLYTQAKSLKPSFLSRHPHFSFITIHYFWIMGMTIIGSILLYPAGGMPYIDALFFASGASTQSGLNTIDINLLNLYQQIVLFFMAMLCNPITINTFVVFLRLYWFEKRFRNIAKEAMKARRSIAKTISKSRSQMKEERNVDREERGVQGRRITVMHNTTRAFSQANELHEADADGIHNEKARPPPTHEQVGSSGDSGSSGKVDSLYKEHESVHVEPISPTIKFAAQVKRSDGMDDELLRMPAPRSEEEHLAILERQRNPSDRGALRIPGPREAERGEAPEELDEVEASRRARTRRESVVESQPARPREDSIGASPTRVQSVGKEHAPKRNITIEEPHRPVQEHIAEEAAAAAHILGGVLRLRKPKIWSRTSSQDEDGHLNTFKGKDSRATTFQSILGTGSRSKDDLAPYLSWQPTVGRNSAFAGLTEEQREELGGIEYRSLKSLALILVLYFWGFWIFGMIGLIPWIMNSDDYAAIVEADGQNKVWWGIFSINSSFTDLGFTLTPDSMISFQSAIWPLLLMSFLIVIGNTGFPIMLRIIIWVTAQYVPKSSGIWEELQFLLDHPRRCFTLLFPAGATWWLFWILVILNGVDLVFFVILDLGNTIVTALPINIRILDGWYQAASTRTAGFAVVNLALLHPAIQVSYMIMMYISVLPIAISVRRTNVYEEKSLGIWGSPEDEEQDESEPSYIGAHLRRQLSFDLWYIFLGFFVISIAEGDKIQNDPAFTMFNVLFEIVSAYGTVGLSLGYPTINASFSAEFGIISKLVMIAMQIRGRHRGLPYELDRAILLPSESLQEQEQQDADMRQRRNSIAVAAARRRSSVSQIDRSGASPTTRRGSRDRNQNFLSSLLHPGPTIPSSHRYANRDINDFENQGKKMRSAYDGAGEDGRVEGLFRPPQHRTSV